MTKLFPIVVALGLAFAFTAPAVATTGPNPAPPTMKSTCEKAKMHLGCASGEVLRGRDDKGPLHVAR